MAAVLSPICASQGSDGNRRVNRVVHLAHEGYVPGGGGQGVGWNLTIGTVVSQAELKEKLAKMYDVRDPQCISVFGFRSQVGKQEARRR